MTRTARTTRPARTLATRTFDPAATYFVTLRGGGAAALVSGADVPGMIARSTAPHLLVITLA